MMKHFLMLWMVAMGVSACASEAQSQDVAIEVAFPGLKFTRPVYVADPGTGDRHLFVIEQAGRVLWFANRADVTGDEVHVALDIREKVLDRGNEEGLLGLAFSPDFETSRELYLHYSAADPRRNVLSRWTMDEAGQTIDPESEEVLLEVEQPYGNHNGGMITFGPPPDDSYLYLSLGDGGSGGDPQNNGQDLSTLLGAILRLDVLNPGPGEAYGIPEDNPFVDQPDARPEIWAYGLRNAWRFSFDAETGDLWTGDVGQNKWEEIDLIVRGGNYGWNIKEGFHDFRPRGRSDDDLIDPVLEYGRQAGVSVTGGYVYRGEAIAELVGAYTYADFGTGRVWMLRYDGEQVTENREIGRVAGPASFGVDRDQELYICSFDGRIYRFEPAD